MDPKILIFEDNDMIRSSLKTLLVWQGYQVQVYSNPGLCPQYGCSNQKCSMDDPCFDIIISDVHMPVQSGLELLANRLELGCKVKFHALMSADWSESDLQHARELGCRVFHKPFDLRELLEWVEFCHNKLETIIA